MSFKLILVPILFLSYSCISRLEREPQLVATEKFVDILELEFLDSLQISDSKCYYAPSLDDYGGCIISFEDIASDVKELLLKNGFKLKDCDNESSIKEFVRKKVSKIGDEVQAEKNELSSCFILKRVNDSRKNDFIEIELFSKTKMMIVYYSQW